MSEGQDEAFIERLTKIVMMALAIGMASAIVAAFAGLAVVVFRAITS